MDLAQLKKHGCDPASYRKLFELEPSERPKKLQKLYELIRSRMWEGMEQNACNARFYAAVDLAYESDYQQQTPTILRHLSTQTYKTPEEIGNACACWGVKTGDVFQKVELGEGKIGYKVNIPAFFQVIVPIVKPYVLARVARILSDYNRVPLLKYEPLRYTKPLRVLCEVLTSVMEGVSTNYNYETVLRQHLLQSKLYGQSVLFPADAWSYEEQLGEDGKPFTVKEGLRYEIPHPTRFYLDPLYRPSTINSDTGCEFAAMWKVTRYGDVRSNPMYWNRDKVFAGRNWLDPLFNQQYFQELYPCKLAFPFRTATVNLREEQAFRYTLNNEDQGLILTDFWWKLIPKKWGLGTYPYPVWHRFVLANEMTIMWVEPVPYQGPLWLGDDTNELAARNGSMALSLVPWQDILSNVVSQMLLTQKQNLMKVVFYDKNIVSEETITNLRGDEKRYEGVQFVGFDSRRMGVDMLNVEKAFHDLRFTPVNIQELVQCIGTVLSLMERVQGLAPQEVGGAASHEQTKTEVNFTASNVNNRIGFSETYVDDFMYAWKKQNYDAYYAYGDEKFAAEVSDKSPETVAALKAFGFDVKPGDHEHNHEVSGKKKQLRFEGFTSSREGQNRTQFAQIAPVVLNILDRLLSNPQLFEAVGTKQLLDQLAEVVQELTGWKDFSFPIDESKGPAAQAEQQAKEIQQMIQQAMQEVEKNVVEQIAKPAAEQIAKLQAEIIAVHKNVEELTQVVAAQQPQPPQPAPQVAVTPAPVVMQ